MSVSFAMIMTASQRGMNSRKLELDGRKKVLIPSVILVRTHSIILIVNIINSGVCVYVCVRVCVRRRRGWLKDSK